MTSWDPAHYLQFGDERTRPARELASRIRVERPARVIDLGCGPGNSARVLRERWPLAKIVGLDSSPDMIAAAVASHPNEVWTLGRIEEWKADTPFDVVFSNAALQWIPHHQDLVTRLFSHVAPGGALAFQIPADAYSPVRQFIHEVAEDEAWRDRMVEARQALTMEPPEMYYDTLASLARDSDIWTTEYQHVMPSHEAIVDWIGSTGLRPFLQALGSEAERHLFRARLLARVREGYLVRTDGRVLFPFRRLFVVAYA